MKVAVFGAAGWLGRAIIANMQAHHEVRAVDYSAEGWKNWDDVDAAWEGEAVYGDIGDYASVDAALEGVDAVVHAAVYAAGTPGGYGVDDEKPFRINLKGLWNILEAARQRGIERIVHVGSCQTVHPQGTFFSADVRRPDGSLYAVSKRLQEEMCRQYHEAFGLSIAVLRPDYIVDSRLGIGRHREKLGKEHSPCRNGWVCRHDLAEACRLAVECAALEFDVFHIVGTPEAAETCNVERSRQVLGLQYVGDLEQYR
ncbi:MAG: nucleoside-diphosphate-sugar epimerase [Candidatus Latescibacterota bacterium]|jgi:nucleoside-diphosphate-sugar epimerase